MRGKISILAITGAALALGSQHAQANFFGFPRILRPDVVRLQLDKPTLPPFAHTRFCIKYPADCEVRRIAFRGGGVKLTPSRWADLVEVNRDVNQAIKPERNNEGLAGERWLLSPELGDCNDYAVTKRHELIKRGWPSRSLLLAEVVTSWGEHHLVLVVRTSSGDFVADNLRPSIRPVGKTGYRWARIQSPGNPKFWTLVAAAGAKGRQLARNAS